VTETGHVRIERGEPVTGGEDLGAVEVEHARQHAPVDRRGGDRVPREQHAVIREMEGDAAVRVPGDVHDPSPAPEVEYVAVRQLGDLRGARVVTTGEVPYGRRVQGALPVLEHR